MRIEIYSAIIFSMTCIWDTQYWCVKVTQITKKLFESDALELQKSMLWIVKATRKSMIWYLGQKEQSCYGIERKK